MDVGALKSTTTTLGGHCAVCVCACGHVRAARRERGYDGLLLTRKHQIPHSTAHTTACTRTPRPTLTHKCATHAQTTDGRTPTQKLCAGRWGARRMGTRQWRGVPATARRSAAASASGWMMSTAKGLRAILLSAPSPAGVVTTATRTRASASAARAARRVYVAVSGVGRCRGGAGAGVWGHLRDKSLACIVGGGVHDWGDDVLGGGGGEGGAGWRTRIWSCSTACESRAVCTTAPPKPALVLATVQMLDLPG